MADHMMGFKAPMVRSLLAGRKTQTRRLPELPEPTAPIAEFVQIGVNLDTGRKVYEMKDAAGRHVALRGGKHLLRHDFLPPIAAGDRIWVRETHYLTDDGDTRFAVYDEDAEQVRRHLERIDALPTWFPAKTRAAHRKRRPSIHMPRWASRITLMVTDVHVQRLQDISEADAIAEGVERLHHGWFPYGISTFMTTVVEGREVPAQCCRTAKQSYSLLWNVINDAGSWEANPWVIAYTFDAPILKNIDEL